MRVSGVLLNPKLVKFVVTKLKWLEEEEVEFLLTFGGNFEHRELTDDELYADGSKNLFVTRIPVFIVHPFYVDNYNLPHEIELPSLEWYLKIQVSEESE